jgi:hypothetical protein
VGKVLVPKIIFDYLVPDGGLLYGCQIFQGREEYMSPLRTANVLDEGSEFTTQGDENFVLIFNRLCSQEETVSKMGSLERVVDTWTAGGRLTIKEWNQLLASALGAQGERDGREAMDGVQTKQNIIML